jgi:hypothetical protein
MYRLAAVRPLMNVEPKDGYILFFGNVTTGTRPTHFIELQISVDGGKIWDTVPIQLQEDIEVYS